MRFSISILFVAFLFPSLFAQSAWTKLDKSEIENFRRGDRVVTPTAYKAFTLDMPMLKNELKKISDRDFSKTRNKKDIIQIPFPNGKMVKFDVWNAPVMESEIASRYPNIKSYKGLSENGKHVIRFMVSNAGFNGIISSAEGTVYVDPIFSENINAYQSYYIKDQEAPDPYWKTCGNTDVSGELKTTPEDVSRSVAAVPVRTYKMAMACTGEYANIVGGTTEAVLNQFNLAVMRLSQVYELSGSMNFILINETDQLIHLDPDTDPYNNANVGASLLGQNNQAITSIINPNLYDIGHVLTRNCTDVGGIAFGGSACMMNKAGGVSCVGNANISSFASGTMAHEVGHQFGVSHSWSNCDPSDPDVQGQLASGWAYEPGSGSTIMSYSGACGSNNTGVDDDYFSVGSLEQLITFTRSDVAGCGTQSVETNNEPVIDMPYEDGFYIPISTAFELDASATDPDGDFLNYSWDQYNIGPISNLGTPIGNAPSFIPVYPDDRSNRYFPRLSWVRGNIDRDIEVKPTYERDLNFRFVVRDLGPLATAAVWEEVEFHVDGNSGPFFVTQPNFNPDPMTVGQEIEVKWDVSNTDVAPVNCQLVNILLSTDDGRTFDRVLAINTENDGSQIVRIPNAQTNEGRIKVEAVGNIFYDMGNASFVIDEPIEPAYSYELTNNFFDICSPAVVGMDIQSSAFLGYDNEVEFSISEGLPDGVIPTFEESIIQPDGSTSLSFDVTEATITGDYVVTLQSISGTDTIEQPIFLNVTSTNFDDLALSFPGNGSSGIEQFPTFEWNAAANATSYTFELATSPAFGDSVVEYDENVSGNTFEPTATLEKSTLYYWRVTPANMCRDGEATRLNTFGTVALSCQSIDAVDPVQNISPSGSGDYKVTKEIFVPNEGTVSAVAVKNVSGNHQRFSNLVFSLESPSGTIATLVSNKCGSTSGNFSCGFEDSSPIQISCPFSEIYQPEEPLSIFNGEDTEGSWYFHINDQTAGNGGTFEEFRLQLCSSETLDPPFVVNNNELGVYPGSRATVVDDFLLIEDENNSADELTYTIVDLPINGHLELLGEEIVIGSQFSQFDVDASRLVYHSDDDTATEDQFTFTCIDGEGGWIDITTFEIAIDASFTSDVKDLENLVEIKVTPNPVFESSIISINNTNGNDYRFSLTNLSGQVFAQSTHTGDKMIEVNVKDYAAGIYY